VSEDRERVKEAEYVKRQDEGEDVEAHKIKMEPEDQAAATEEGPDVEGHLIRPRVKE
jgi:hypothetical protein